MKTLVNRPSFTFKPELRQIGTMYQYTIQELKDEPMFFSAGSVFAAKMGGPLTNQFLDILHGAGLDFGGDSIIVDSRTHMLMKGWYPCIPGWHHDDVPRKGLYDQPNYIDPEYVAEHAMAIVDCGTGSLTEFWTGEATLELPDDPSSTIYDVWNKKLNSITRMTPTTWRGPGIVDNLGVYTFSSDDFHRGMPAKANGWRWFIRASWKTKRKVHNEIRKQTQVYMSALEAGW